ncbi:hypothetical protein [Polaribacter sargassicola]|uniref:hypothetical protein n=1 Tax=Polaribacter sargassicola TaxID=2836891 RepID=UPI001F31FB08|nr:hypothetical protein [Polaribacter sp. DS7-9]MCG1035208.1 hypothetical protein [Polaribacter sp. DS7-9]
MKKLLSIFFIAISSQMMNAHVQTTSHTHDSFISEWAWLLIPAIALVAIVWKMTQTKLKNSKN